MEKIRRRERTGQWKDALTGILFPRTCPVCGEIILPKGKLICPGCRNKLHYVSGSLCLRCGKELVEEDGEYCFGCLHHPKSFVQGISLLNYEEVSSRSLVQIKYKNKREYLDFYSQEMADKLGGKIKRIKAEAFIPVPVHPARKRTRGFNQAEELALRLSALTDIPVCSDLLIRSRKTAPQKELTPTQRLNNLEQAFQVNTHGKSYGLRTVILVDDIYTTGSTAEACTRVLRAAGIENVYVLTICIGGDK